MSRTVFASSKEGKLFVKLKAIMHPLCALCDGLPVTFFGKGKTAYLDIETAIGWCEREKQHHSKAKYEAILAVLRKAKQQHATEEE